MKDFNYSLLSESYIKNSFFYIKDNIKSINSILNIDLILKEIENTTHKTNIGYSYKENGYFVAIKTIFNNNIDYKKYKKNIFYSKNSLEIIKYLYFEIYYYLNLYEKEIIDLIEFKKNIINFLNIEKRKYKLNQNKNRNLLIANNSSYLYSKNKKELFLYKDLIKEIGFQELEIPQGFLRRELGNFLNQILFLKKRLNIKKFNFILRIKRIKKYKKNGMFIKNANTIILDPRELKNFIHELGHYIYENNLAFNFNNKRIYKNSFNKIIKDIDNNNDIILNKYSKYEDYELDSEIFAFWFEKIFKF